LDLSEQDFREQMDERVREVEVIIAPYLPPETGPRRKLLEAMNYSIEVGGKRLRPMLVRESYRLFEAVIYDDNICYPFMAALEMIHTYSLVHDDLPAMDNDTYRRGRETTHVVYGEAMAILAGDALLNLAFETVLKAWEHNAPTHFEVLVAYVEALNVLARKAGARGMIGGQAVDLLAERGETLHSEELLKFIHVNKTAALIEAAMMIGGILAGAAPDDIIKLEQAGRNIGLAFQLQDDILDVTGDPDKLGKPTGSDERNEKFTGVTLKGLDECREEVARLSEEAIDILSSFPRENAFLLKLVESLVGREK
jgi:geranylgeranyl diphosphate synthase type II